jgi:hypothetical protein
VFLPLISVAMLLVGWLLPAPAQEPGPGVVPRVSVVAGTGEPDPEVVARVDAAVAAELPRLLPLFDGRPRHAFFVHVHATRAQLPPALAERLHPDSPAFAVLGQHQIHVVWGEVVRTGSRLTGVVRHELVHELLDQFVAPNGRYLPRWFHEGLAQHLAGDTYLRASENDLVWGMSMLRLPPFGALRERFPTESNELRRAYAQSYSYVSWLAARYGVEALLAVARSADSYVTFEAALVGRTGRSTLQLEDAWRDHVVHGSGAPWRVLGENWFTYCLLALLPVLALAMIRRLRAEERAGRQLVQQEAELARAAEPPAAEPPSRE